jgi:DNA-binding MarR family transcriptional regulator
MITSKDAEISSASLQSQMIALVRAFGLHKPDTTPCGQPVSVAEAHALLELERAAPLSQNELASRLMLEKSTVSRLVAALEQHGWISRIRSQRDARQIELSLTEEGRRIQGQIAAARAAKFQRVLEAVPDTQRERVLDGLNILVEALHASSN